VSSGESFLVLDVFKEDLSAAGDAGGGTVFVFFSLIRIPSFSFIAGVSSEVK